MDAERKLTWLAWILTATGLIAVAAVASASVSQPGMNLLEKLSTGTIDVGVAAFVLSGALIVNSRPRNIVGWLLMLPGLALPLSDLSAAWLLSLTPPPVAHDALTWLLAWFSNWSWILLIFPIFFVLLIFPSGTLLSPRWRGILLFDAAMAATMLVLATFSNELGPPSDGDPAWVLPNPIGFIRNDIWDSALGTLWSVSLLVATAAGVAAVIVRFRRGSARERQQLKWPLLGIFFFGAVYALTAINSGWEGQAFFAPLFGLSLAAIPVTVALAVTRHGLYEIDRIISRTVSWTLLTGCLAAIFAAVVLGVQALLSDVTQGQSLAIAASTLVVSMLFNPIRLRLQRAVDQRFNRSRYDADRTVAAFAERLRDQVELGQLDEALMDVVTSVVQPDGASLWLRGDRPGA